MKIIYTGIRHENYDPRRNPSFEYNNFFLTFKHYPGIEVIEYPYDQILRVGKKRFNEDLLRLTEREKPDLVFAFMYTDELALKTLDAIKARTRSIAWFADDHWRFHNYSRFLAPHFTWAVTTYSKALDWYKERGITNVIRSQWACNTFMWKPANVKRDIDVSFIGQYTPGRERMVRELKRLGIDVFVRGWGWPEGRLNQEEMIKSFSRTKINLNFNTPPSRWRLKQCARLFMRRSVGHIVPDVQHLVANIISWRNMAIPQIKARPFEILGCRTFLLSQLADDMHQYYEDKREIVYCNTVQDFAQKIRYYVQHDGERENIARQGYERTIREHTYEKRFQDIFTQIGLS